MKSFKQFAYMGFCALLLSISACKKKDSPSSSEPPEEGTSWNAIYGGDRFEEGSVIHRLSDGYIIVGSTNSSNNGDIGATKGDHDLWLIRLDAAGKKIWQKTYGGSNNEYIFGIVPNPDGSFVGVGFTGSNNSGDIGATKGVHDIWIVKVDANGDLVWNKTYGGDNYEAAFSIARTSDGKYLVTGYTNSANSGDIGSAHGGEDILVAKITAEGNLEWLQTYGGASDERGRKIIANPDGSILVGGYSSSNSSGNVGTSKGSNDMFLLKLDASGIFQASSNYGGNKPEYLSHMLSTSDGGYMLFGTTESNDNGDVGSGKGGTDCWMVKVDGNGVLKWQKIIGGSNSEWFSGVTSIADGGYAAMITTYSNNSGDIGVNKGKSDIALVKLSATGTINSIKMIGGEDQDEMLHLTNAIDGGYIGVGYSRSKTGDIGKNNGENDLLIVKAKDF